MKIRNFIVAALASTMMVAMSSAVFAEGPNPVQQKPMQQQQQQMPVKPMPQGQMPVKPAPMPQGQWHHPGQQQHPQKVRFIRVHRGDSLSSIAYRYHMRVATLKRLNHLRGNTIFVGQRLRVR
jgi:hypothetical protein